MALTAKRRSELRAEAHKLNPVVIIGDKGLTDEVLAEIDRSLKAHELIKVRATAGDRDAREIWFEKICEALGAQEVQEIGKILVVYRENQERRAKSEEKTPKPASPKRRLRPSLSALDTAKRSGRRQSRTPSPLPESSPRRRRPRSSR
ncbi:MAG TPA: ribosome assembly RNA-binding protein YhbY [Usitatibacter sp.]|nr:ribosome assembly RNA-binding protein YhbY [Usitatibacter sp.]